MKRCYAWGFVVGFLLDLATTAYLVRIERDVRQDLAVGFDAAMRGAAGL